MNRILVIGASGRVGRQVVSQLSATDAKVRALFRNPHLANLSPQVEIVKGDLTQPETLDASLKGVDSVFLVWTALPLTIPEVLERIAKQARHIVFLTAPHQTPHPLFQQPNPLALMHAGIEQRIKDSGMTWTFLRPGMFAANASEWWAGQIRAGNIVRWPYALVPTAPIHERDIAAVGVRALLDDKCAGAEYVLTGPQSLNHSEQVLTIGDVLGRPLRFEEITPDEARRELLTVIPAPGVKMLLDAWGAAFGHPALITKTVEEITGIPARTFREWVTENAKKF